MEYRIYYSFSGYGTTHIEAASEEEAREQFYNSNYQSEDEETEDYEITDIAGPEQLTRERRNRESHNIIDNETMPIDKENYCRCGNPVEEKGEVCDQCWAGIIQR